MKIIIEDGCFSYQVDWSKKDMVMDGEAIEYRPDLEECVESFLCLLENVFPQKKISDYVAEGVKYSGAPIEMLNGEKIPL